MPRRYDIEAAFRSAVVVSGDAETPTRTVDFVQRTEEGELGFLLAGCKCLDR